MTSEFKKPTSDELKKKLNPLQYKVTQEEGTEPPFKNEYWDNHAEGIYVDIVSGEPLFSSTDKYDSGTGWPSFTKPIDKDNLVEKEDHKLFSTRTEVRSKHGDSHLGHVFLTGQNQQASVIASIRLLCVSFQKTTLKKKVTGSTKNFLKSPVRFATLKSLLYIKEREEQSDGRGFLNSSGGFFANSKVHPISDLK